MKMCRYELKEIDGRKTIICTIQNNHLIAVGKAKCSPTDEFDLRFGKRLAYTRAKIKFNTKKMNLLFRDVTRLDNELARLANHNDTLRMMEHVKKWGKFKRS